MFAMIIYRAEGRVNPIVAGQELLWALCEGRAA
jgi:hypothetical protein